MICSKHLASNYMFSLFFKLQLILNGVKNCSMPEIRANWLRMLGTLGCLLNEALVRVIISFIVETCSNVGFNSPRD